MSARRFTIGVLISVAACLMLAYAAHLARARSVNNLLILRHQLAKLSAPDARDTEIAVLGDSAAGTAIHAPTFSALTGSLTQNLALTGGYGFISDYALIQRAQQAWPKLHTIVILHSLDIWRRKSSANAFARVYSPDIDFSLVKGRERGWLQRFKVRTNVKELEWYVKGLFSSPQPLHISAETEYPTQAGAHFSTGDKTIDPAERLRPAIHPDKVDMFGSLDALAQRTGLRVIYAHAPIHQVVARNSASTIEQINAILASAKTLRAVPDINAYPGEMMGNSTDHVSPLMQRKVTREYYELLQPHLLD